MASITKSEHGTISVEGREAVEFVRVLYIRRALMLEIKTGMVMTSRASTLRAAQSTGLTTAGTKKRALADIEAALRAAGVDLDD